MTAPLRSKRYMPVERPCCSVTTRSLPSTFAKHFSNESSCRVISLSWSLCINNTKFVTTSSREKTISSKLLARFGLCMSVSHNVFAKLCTPNTRVRTASMPANNSLPCTSSADATRLLPISCPHGTGIIKENRGKSELIGIFGVRGEDMFDVRKGGEDAGEGEHAEGGGKFPASSDSNCAILAFFASNSSCKFIAMTWISSEIRCRSAQDMDASGTLSVCSGTLSVCCGTLSHPANRTSGTESFGTTELSAPISFLSA
mmetsp:Transcript_57239/g.152669  ORF Transcript_57239/g.152669 Transcript_57239/m.152669 type:complete len:258 (-) Transcript_57239:522-1295(-)